MGRRRRAAGAVAAVVVVLAAGGCRPGTPDTGFGEDGTAVLDGPAGAVSATPAGDGKVVAVVGDGQAVRLAADGTVVAGWGGPLPVPCAERDEVDRDDMGRFLVACTSTATDGTRVTDVVRLKADGRPDPGFGAAGVARLPGSIEGAAAVPLPGGRVLALGGPPPVTGAEGVLVTTVLDGRGQVVSTGEQVVAQVPDVPDEYKAGVAVFVVAEPTDSGAVAAIHAATVLNLTDVFRPTEPFLLTFDATGAESARLEGPTAPGNAAWSHVTAVDELPGGRFAVLEEWWRLVDGPRPFGESGHRVHVFAGDGTSERSFVPETAPTPEAPAGPISAETLLVTGGGRHLLVGGVGASGDTWRGTVVRYDTSTWRLDPGFGTAGVADVGALNVHDLDGRAGDPGRVDVTGPYGGPPAPPGPPAAVTRLWNQTPPDT